MSSDQLLREVAATASKVVDARAEYKKAVRAAHEGGISLREIGFAAGVSHEQVRRLIQAK